MALVTEVNFKAAIALAAAQLTIAFSDTVKTEMAPVIKNPHHPLRQVDQMFIYNRATGVVAANDDYIAAAYAGKYPPQNDLEAFVAEEAIALVSATVEDADPTEIVLTFDANVNGIKDLSIAGTVTTPKAIQSVSIVGAVVTITVTTAYIFGDTISVSGTFTGNNLNGVTLAAEAVTNNVLA